MIVKVILGLSKHLKKGHVSTSILDSDQMYLALCFLHVLDGRALKTICLANIQAVD